MIMDPGVQHEPRSDHCSGNKDSEETEIHSREPSNTCLLRQEPAFIQETLSVLETHFPSAASETFQSIGKLLENNKMWASAKTMADPLYFKKLAALQAPKVLWIGCSDSRVPANTLIGLGPGEVFVHRNVANIVNNTDLNCLSVVQFAVDILKVKHIIVCGHYGCGGVLTSMTSQKCGLVDNWLITLKGLYRQHKEKLEGIEDQKLRGDYLTELNVFNSVEALCATSVIQDAWKRGQELSIHGWCYKISDGILRDLGICVKGIDQIDKIYSYS